MDAGGVMRWGCEDGFCGAAVFATFDDAFILLACFTNAC